MADSGTTIAKAYIQLVPSAEGIGNSITEALGDEGDKAGEAGGKRAGGAFATALKASAAAVAAAGAAVGAIVKSSVQEYANYEQLVGGVETLFGAGGRSLEEYAASVGKSVSEAGAEYYKLEAAQGAVMANAANAYKTAGLSANEYMETATGMAAALNQSLGGDTMAAAKYADMAITDMADNANKMGSSMESIQNAYAGFAKGNYTMLDNLKLGYGGTGEEMKRLIEDAEKLDSSFTASRDSNGELAMSYADIVDAIHIVQDNMGIAGTTAKEAVSTISGSLSMMQSAWQNLLVGMADGSQDLGLLIDNLVESAVTFGENLLPTIEQALTGVGEVVTGLAPVIAEQLPGLIEAILPSLLTAATQLMTSLTEALPSILSVLVNTIPTLLPPIIEAIVALAPELASLALDLLLALADGIVAALPTLIPALVDVIYTITMKLTDPETINSLIQAAFAILMALGQGLIAAIPSIIQNVPVIVMNIVSALIEGVGEIASAGVQLTLGLADGLVRQMSSVVDSAHQIWESIKNAFKERLSQAKEWGRDLLQNFISGIKEKISSLTSGISSIASTIASYLHFSEPDVGPLSDFHTYAPDMMQLFATGIRENLGLVKDAAYDAAAAAALVMTPAAPQASTALAGTPQADVAKAIADALRNVRVYLDGNKTVGYLVPGIDSELGARQAAALRGAI